MSLTLNQLQKFEEDGFLVIENLFSIDEVKKMRNCFDNLVQLAHEFRQTGLYNKSHFVIDFMDDELIIKRVVWASGSQEYLLKVGQDQRILSIVSELLGSDEFDQLLGQAHFKRPGDKVIFDWHQDITHRDKGNGTWFDVNGKGSYIQTAICLDDMTKDNGPIIFIPGSHKFGVLNFGNHSYDEDYQYEIPKNIDLTDQKMITTSSGSMIFFGPYTVHASFENTTSHSRRVFINGYAYPGANHRVYPGEGAGRRLIFRPS